MPDDRRDPDDGPSHPSAAAWRAAIFDYIRTHPSQPHKPRHLARDLDIPDSDYRAFRDLLRVMVRSGEVIVGSRRQLKLPETSSTFVGTFHGNERGFGFITPQRPANEAPQSGAPTDKRDDVFVPAAYTNGALDGDVVRAQLLRPRRGFDDLRAGVVGIVQRASRAWVGTLEQAGRRWYVRPIGKPGAPLVEVEDPGAKSAESGDLVSVEPLEHTLNRSVAQGVLVERFGAPSDAQAAIHATIERFGIPHEFPEAVRDAAQAAAATLSTDPDEDREDLRDLLTITIDPRDARDFDDAISIEQRDNDIIRLGVHIADVAHFVKPGSPLDDEARGRGNSCYFPRHVVPMLPEVLSNGVCSLQPNVPRYAKSVFIDYDKQAKVVGTEFANALICSDARLTYEEASAALAGDRIDYPDEVKWLLTRAGRLAKRIQQRRLASGMLVLNLPEVELELDGDGQIVGAGPADTSYSHTLIEMFMVEANEAVCRRLTRLDVACVRRAHPEPDPLATRTLDALRPLLGDKLPDALTRETIQQLITTFRNKPQEQAVNFLLLRSLAQAYYTTETIGHFALASEHYSHFTSPIRRYPDLINHRLLDMDLRGQLDPITVEELRTSQSEREADAQNCSTTERRAQQAERAIHKTLLVMLMSKHIGEDFDGLIVGAVGAGVFVQMQPHLAEGMIPVDAFGSDFWQYDQRGQVFVGQRTRRLISIGQRVRVTVAAVDLAREEVTLVPADDQPLGVVRKDAERVIRRSGSDRSGKGGKGRGRGGGRDSGGSARGSSRPGARGKSKARSRRR